MSNQYGTYNYSIPLSLPQSRGRTPDLNLAYSSSVSNGIFGMVFDINIDKVSIKTNKEIKKI